MKTRDTIRWLSVGLVVALSLLSIQGFFIWKLSDQTGSEPSSAAAVPLGAPQANKHSPFAAIRPKTPADPFQAFQNQVDRMFEQFGMNNNVFGASPFASSGSEVNFQVKDQGDKIEYDVAYNKGDDVELKTDLTDGQLTISGSVSYGSKAQGSGSMNFSQGTSRFTRSFTLPANVDPDSMQVDRQQDRVVITFTKR